MSEDETAKPEEPVTDETQAEAPATDETQAEAPATDETQAEAPATDETAPTPDVSAAADEAAPSSEGAVAASQEAGATAEETASAPQPAVPAPEGSALTQAPDAAAAPTAQADAGDDGDEEDEEEEEPQPRVKPEVPGMHLEVDIVPEGADPFGKDQPDDPYAVDPYATEEEAEEQQATEQEDEEQQAQPISSAAIDLARGARYIATGKRKTAIARVILKPGSGDYLVNGRSLEQHVPRLTLQRNVRQPLETVGYQERMDVIARVHGGGVSAQAGALRHGIAKALIDADPNLRSELKRRGFLTRDARVKERKKAGLKKARKRPQFSKR